MNIDNVIAKAQRLMLDENWTQQVEMAGAAFSAGSLNGKKTGFNDLAAFEAQAFGSVQAPSAEQGLYTPIPESAKAQRGNRRANSMMLDNGKPVQILQETKQEVNLSNSKLPKAILESFKNQPSPLETSQSYDAPPASYYSTPQQSLMEQAVPQYSNPMPQNNGVDYNYIKYLIKEAISEYTSALNESTNTANFRGMRITDGNVFQFIDSKGNLYEGTLKLKKKTNK